MDLFNIKELQPVYENKKSYYKKAIVKSYEEETENGLYTIYELYSYDTQVCTIELFEDNFTCTPRQSYILNDYSFYSQTTSRHVKEFLKQYLIPDELKTKLIENNFNYKIIQKYNNTKFTKIY